MNIFPAKVVSGDGSYRLVAGEVTLEVPPSHRSRLADYVDREVLLGIRPEDLEVVVGSEAQRGDTVRLPVELIEPLGAETLVHLRGPAGTLIAQGEPRIHLNPGDVVTVRVRTEHLHTFDPQTEMAIF